MTVYEFAGIYLQPYTQKGNEILPVYCPFCKGGDHKDKQSFALNADNKTFNCKRGSCGKQGHFTELCKAFGVEADRENNVNQRTTPGEKKYIPPVKKYRKPETKAEAADDTVKKYLALRKISEATINAYKVGSDGKGNIVFPFYDEKSEHIFTKFRPARKLEKSERKSWREADTKPILFGMHLCDYSESLCITEGEIDAMSLFEAGIPNAVSVPSGAEDFTWLDTCWDWVKRFDKIVLFGDNDAPGLEMLKKLSVKLSDKQIYIAEHEYKDANELLYRKGAETVKEAYKSAKEVPVYGLIDLASVVPLDVTNIKKATSSIKELNKILNGFKYGDVSVWTGKRGEGKSTLLSMLMLDAIECGVNVCAYSGELPDAAFQYWVDLQAAGKSNISSYYDRSIEEEVYYVPNETRNLIHAWYARRFWLYDNRIVDDGNEEAAVLKVFEIAAKRYDCKVFLIDNLMTANDTVLNDRDFYRQQSNFVGKIVKFAKKLDAHVHLVAHPRKENGQLTNDSVSGSGDITNRPANVLSVKKLSDAEAANAGFDVALEVTKNRWHGKLGKIGLNYCKTSRRLYVPSQGNAVKYGWESEQNDKEPIDITSKEEIEDLPWENF